MCLTCVIGFFHVKLGRVKAFRISSISGIANIIGCEQASVGVPRVVDGGVHVSVQVAASVNEVKLVQSTAERPGGQAKLIFVLIRPETIDRTFTLEVRVVGPHALGVQRLLCMLE